jgi:hypothetical protein
METVKKSRRTGVVSVGVANGKSGTLSPDVIRARKDERTWDVRWYNFQDQKWEREGERLTYRQAYAKAYNLGKANPYAKIGVVLITGRRPNANLNGSDSPKVDVDA